MYHVVLSYMYLSKEAAFIILINFHDKTFIGLHFSE